MLASRVRFCLGKACRGSKVSVQNSALSTQPDPDQVSSPTTPATNQSPKVEPFCPPDFRDAFPDFLPQPHWHWRNKIVEKLERQDMLRRRTKLDVPEFYVGSIVAVTSSDRFVAGQKNRFLGIVIRRERTGLRHNFVLRNVIDGMGIEIMFELYNPLIQKIEVIRLERWIDEDLAYLRDCREEFSYFAGDLAYLRDCREEFSTFPFDLHPTPHPPGTPVPLNTSKVQLKIPPWSLKWLNYDFKNVDMHHAWKTATPNARHRFARMRGMANPPTEKQKEWQEKFDIASAYRAEVGAEDVEEAAWAAAEEEAAIQSPSPPRHLLRHRNRPKRS